MTYQPTPLERATTIPASWYLDPEWLARDREKVFFRTWQWVGRSADVARRGDTFTRDLLTEPLVVTRDLEGNLGAFYNVCRHRAGPVAEGAASRKQLQCLYHGWTYSLDGRLRRAPEMEGVEDFDPSTVCLPRVSIVEWAPLLFVRLEGEGPSFAETLGSIPEEVSGAGFPVDRMRLVERREYLVESNWKVYVDNYLEGYHIPMIHPALFREVDYERYRVETHRFHSAQLAPLRSGNGAGRTYPKSKEDEKALYYWVFPNLMLNFYPGNLQVNVVLPVEPERTRTIFEWYALDEARGLEDAIAFSDQVQKEDMEICRLVQKGLRSRSYDRGRFSRRRENGVHHFHLLLHEHLTQSAASGAFDSAKATSKPRRSPEGVAGRKRSRR